MSEHAIANAKAWLEMIEEIAARFIRDERTAEAAREEAEQSALSVQVRSGWHAPGSDRGRPEEFEILLSTGGPALRIVGNLDEYCEPTSARLEWQDWGTLWTPLGDLTGAQWDALLVFARCFYFGEG